MTLFTLQLVAGILAIVALIAVAASTNKLSNSGKEKDPQRAILFAAQSAAGFLFAMWLSTLAAVTILFIR